MIVSTDTKLLQERRRWKAMERAHMRYVFYSNAFVLFNRGCNARRGDVFAFSFARTCSEVAKYQECYLASVFHNLPQRAPLRRTAPTSEESTKLEDVQLYNTSM